LVKPIPAEKKGQVIRFWLQGYNYREINEETNVSTGSISEIVEEERKRIPNVDDIRSLNLSLKKEGTSLADALRGSNLMTEFNELNVSIPDLPDCIKLLREYGVEAGSVLEKGTRLRKLEEKTERSYEQIVFDFEKTIKKEQELTTKVKELRSDEKNLKA
jgi:hypothetical protein